MFNRKAYKKAYNQKPEVKEKRATQECRFVSAFFTEYRRNRAWKTEGIEKMAKAFSETVSELQKKEQGKLYLAILHKGAMQ